MGGGLSGFGVLRIDLALPYETAPLLNEIVSLAANRWMPDFTISILYTKAGHTKARIPVLKNTDLLRPIHSAQGWATMKNSKYKFLLTEIHFFLQRTKKTCAS